MENNALTVPVGTGCSINCRHPSFDSHSFGLLSWPWPHVENCLRGHRESRRWAKSLDRANDLRTLNHPYDDLPSAGDPCGLRSSIWLPGKLPSIRGRPSSTAIVWDIFKWIRRWLRATARSSLKPVSVPPRVEFGWGKPSGMTTQKIRVREYAKIFSGLCATTGIARWGCSIPKRQFPFRLKAVRVKVVECPAVTGAAEIFVDRTGAIRPGTPA